MKASITDDGRSELRAVIGSRYGRAHDHGLVEAVMRIAGNGTGDTRWKVPGVLDWGVPFDDRRVRARRRLGPTARSGRASGGRGP